MLVEIHTDLTVGNPYIATVYIYTSWKRAVQIKFDIGNEQVSWEKRGTDKIHCGGANSFNSCME